MCIYYRIIFVYHNIKQYIFDVNQFSTLLSVSIEDVKGQRSFMTPLEVKVKEFN